MSASTELWLTFALSVFLAYMTDRYSEYTYDGAGDRIYLRKNRFFYAALVIVMSLFVGLRTWCNDTGTYIYGYQTTSSTGSILKDIDWSLGASPLFTVVNRILRHLDFSSQSFLMFYSFLTNGIYLWFVRKYSHNFTISVFLLWTMGVYLFTAAAMRQTVAIVFGAVAVDRAAKKNWKQFVLWCAIGSMFHPYVLLFLAAPFLREPAWKKKTLLLIGACIVCGLGMTFFLPLILRVTTIIGRGAEYTVNEFSSEGVNIFRLLVIWAPIIFSFVLREKVQKNENDTDNMIMNLSVVNAGLMFIALFGTANYFARLANYFLIFQTLSLPWMMKFLSPKNQKTMKFIIVICYLLYFIFANVILTPFDTYMAKMSLREYLSGLLN